VTMGFCGVVDINAVNSSVLNVPTLTSDTARGADIVPRPRSGA
jgi:hypothetical protein